MAFFLCSKHPTTIEYYGCCCLLLLTDPSGLLVVVALAIVFGGRLNDSQRAALTGGVLGGAGGLLVGTALGVFADCLNWSYGKGTYMIFCHPIPNLRIDLNMKDWKSTHRFHSCLLV